MDGEVVRVFASTEASAAARCTGRYLQWPHRAARRISVVKTPRWYSVTKPNDRCVIKTQCLPWRMSMSSRSDQTMLYACNVDQTQRSVEQALQVATMRNTSSTAPLNTAGWCARNPASSCVDCNDKNCADVVGVVNLLERGYRLLACGEPVQSSRSVKQKLTEAPAQIAV